MYVIKDALEKAGSTEPDKLREAFVATDLQSGPAQMYASQTKFDETGQMINAPLVICQYQKVNGKMERVTVWPEKEARVGSQIVWPYPGAGN
jgi:branched-chain amino acid transport system substrate-binding protein